MTDGQMVKVPDVNCVELVDGSVVQRQDAHQMLVVGSQGLLFYCPLLRSGICKIPNPKAKSINILDYPSEIHSILPLK